MSLRQRLGRSFTSAHPEDAARILEGSSPHDVAAYLEEIPPDTAASLIACLHLPFAVDVLSAANVERAAELCVRLPRDRAALLLRRIETATAERILGAVPQDRARTVKSLMRYPEWTAAALADSEVATLTPDMSVGTAKKRVERSREHVYSSFYVVDRDGRLIGVIGVGDLLHARAADRVDAIMIRDIVNLAAHTDVDTLASHPAWQRLDTLPVVDRSGLFLGVVRHRRIRQILLTARAEDRSGVGEVAVLAELYWISLSNLVAGIGEMLATSTATREASGRN